MQITERDYAILKTISKFRFLLSRQIRILCGFSGQRACDRRLRLLIDNGYIERKKILYGIPSLYFATPTAKKVFQLDYITNTTRVEQIRHDILVVDTAIYLKDKLNVPLDKIISERQLKHSFGFGVNKHTPDLVIIEPKRACVEVELSVKAKETLEKNIKKNYLEFSSQLWFVDFSKLDLLKTLKELANLFELQIINIEEVKEHVKTLQK